LNKAAMILSVLVFLGLPIVSRADASWNIATHADCTRPDGSSYFTEIISLNDGTVRFTQGDSLPDVEYLIHKGLAYEAAEDGESFLSSTANLVEFVQGHDIHRMILDLPVEEPRPERFVFEIAPENGGGEVIIELSDWRPVVQLELPHKAVIIHNNEHFTFDFTEILPFHLAPHTMLSDSAKVAFDRLGDLYQIAALHERGMAAHRATDVDMILEDMGPTSVISSRGHLYTSNRQSARKIFESYFAETTFDFYADVKVPVIDLAADGSLGWLACEIEASGTVVDEFGASSELEFGYSWVELLNKTDGRWFNVGNASCERLR
jgi:hypothetical protein